MTKDKALDLAKEALENSLPRLAPYGEQDWLDSKAAITAIKQALAAQPAVQEPLGYLEIDDIESQREYPHNCRNVNLWHEGGEGMAAIYTTPPAHPAPAPEGRDWSLLEATQESLREHMAEIKRLKEAQPAPVQEPVVMRMPKVGDKVVCIEDESLGTVVYLTAGGSPEIKFDDGSHGTYMLREFAELFGYTTPPNVATPPAAKRPWVGLTDNERGKVYADWRWIDGRTNNLALCEAIEAKLKELNT